LAGSAIPPYISYHQSILAKDGQTDKELWWPNRGALRKHRLPPPTHETNSMHTLIVTTVGFVLLAIFLLGSKNKSSAAKRFIPVWLVLCVIHLAYGVLEAGYGLVDELGVHAVVFGVPALCAWWLSGRFAGKS
jgi:hypothetical protein